MRPRRGASNRASRSRSGKQGKRANLHKPDISAATELVGGAAASDTQDDRSAASGREPRPLSNTGRRRSDGTVETFKELQGTRPGRPVVGDMELFEEQKARQLEEERHSRHARKVFHRHERSSSRASDSSGRAEEEVERMQVDVERNEQV